MFMYLVEQQELCYVSVCCTVFWTGSNRIPVAGVESMKVMVLTPHVMCTHSAVAYANSAGTVCHSFDPEVSQ